MKVGANHLTVMPGTPIDMLTELFLFLFPSLVINMLIGHTWTVNALYFVTSLEASNNDTCKRIICHMSIIPSVPHNPYNAS